MRDLETNVQISEGVRQPHVATKQENPQDRRQAVEMTSICPSSDPTATLQVPSFPVPSLAAAASHSFIPVPNQELDESMMQTNSDGSRQNSFDRTEADEMDKDQKLRQASSRLEEQIKLMFTEWKVHFPQLTKDKLKDVPMTRQYGGPTDTTLRALLNNYEKIGGNLSVMTDKVKETFDMQRTCIWEAVRQKKPDMTILFSRLMDSSHIIEKINRFLNSMNLALPIAVSPSNTGSGKTNRNGKQLMVECYNNDENIEVEVQGKKRTVNVYKCQNSVVNVLGKCKSVILHSCNRTRVVSDNLLSQVEIINCQSVTIKTLGHMSTLSIEKTKGCMIYCREQTKKMELIASKSSEMNVLVPAEGGKFLAYPVPNQLKGVFNLSETRPRLVEIKEGMDFQILRPL
ncbi:hypothetical protein QR680_006974 [Steinernema hermaphroditum]|uniref:C-CAP/cofactor C-like domain-containing protein n=1 Tax=Steinernema hermaphroditum TaxID=289476 RepID=A0AA39HZP3_9BILA|nr:hypothetical protein QR680_006974 [Steinernema hermaphroditum]